MAYFPQDEELSFSLEDYAAAYAMQRMRRFLELSRHVKKRRLYTSTADPLVLYSDYDQWVQQRIHKDNREWP